MSSFKPLIAERQHMGQKAKPKAGHAALEDSIGWVCKEGEGSAGGSGHFSLAWPGAQGCQVEMSGQAGCALRAGNEGRRHPGRSWPYPQVIFLLFSLYPVEGLLLGVDAEGEAAGPGGKDAVLNRELIGGQPLGSPPGKDSDREIYFPCRLVTECQG